MKTKINILLVLLLTAGLACHSYAQGLVNNGGYIKGSSSSYIKFSGNGNMSIKSTTADRTTLGNMTVDFTGGGTYKLTIPDDSYVTVDGNLSLSDSLLLKASSSGMASLITNGSVSGSYARVEQYLSQDQWHLVSAPVSSAKSNVYLNIYLKSFRESDSTWSWITNTNTPLNVTEGYAVWSSSAFTGNTTVKFRGTLNTGDKSATVTYNNGAGMGDGWNLLGNPYPSAIEWNSSWTKSNIDATVYVYDGIQYLTWNYNLGGYGTKTDGAIPSTQGFWIKTNAASPSITIPNAERIHSGQSFYKNSDPSAGILNVQVTGNGYSDNTLIGFYADATDQFDSEYDAYKIKGIFAAPQLYTVMHNDEMAVNILAGMASDIQQKTVPLSIEVGQPGTYTFDFSGLDGLEQGTSVYLEDRYTSGFGTSGSKLIDIRNTSQYAFSARPQDDPARFYIHFNLRVEKPNEEPGDGLAGETTIYSFEKNVYVMVKDVNAEVSIFDMLGKKVLVEKIPANLLRTFHLGSPQGYYIVNVVTANGLQSEKVFIR
ncbi:MAG: T9SS type A sorting domain-containing protein [Bacteroidales bacterium]|nr:T9SS type A sorting domain-containing protein [Bacteroidales bacterium]